MITWNLFHGRDRAPDPALHTWRSRLLRISERGDTHAQVNRDLFAQFSTVLCDADWDIALLQECPPRWAEDLATTCRAEPHLVLTSRNLPSPLDRLQRVAGRINPDLLASWEGGCNLTLVRGERHRGRVIGERRELTLATQPERRQMAFTRLVAGLCVANLHAGEERSAAESEVAQAARTAREWAGADALILGGDFNLRPATSAALFAALGRDHGLSGATGPKAIDHLLIHGLRLLEQPAAWEPSAREVTDSSAEGLAIRLSDHAPVEGRFALPFPPD